MLHKSLLPQFQCILQFSYSNDAHTVQHGCQALHPTDGTRLHEIIHTEPRTGAAFKCAHYVALRRKRKKKTENVM